MNFCDSLDRLPKNIIKKLDNAPLFFSKEYEKNVLSRGQKPIYIWSDSTILVARVKKQLFLRAALLECEPYTYNLDKYENEKIFLDSAMKVFKKLGIQWTMTTNTSRFHEYPTNAKTILSGNHIIDLTQTEEELWSNMHSKHRNSVRRGEKGEMDLEIGNKELIDRYTPLSNETYARSGQGGTVSHYYSSLVKHLEKNSIIALLSKDGELQAGGIFFYNSSIAYYLHGASVSRPEPGSTNYLLWTVIMMMKEKGVKEFSFVGYHVDAEPGSKLDGIQKFKERFGGRLENCYSFKYIQKPLYYKMYCLAMRLKSKKLLHKYQDHIDEQINKYPELNIKVGTK